MTDLTDTAIGKGYASFEKTFGRVPENFRLMAAHAPGAFAGYALMRDWVMRDTQEGAALDLRTKELIFALLDTLAGQVTGARNHAAAAVRLGLPLGALAEGLAQVIMVGGVTTWNQVGAEVMRHCEAVAAERDAAPPPG